MDTALVKVDELGRFYFTFYRKNSSASIDKHSVLYYDKGVDPNIMERGAFL